MLIGSILQIYPFDFKPSPPPAGAFLIYAKTDDIIYLQDDTGTEFPFASAALITSLTGDVTGTGPGAAVTTVNSVGGQSAASIASATVTVAAATAVNTSSTLVFRDSSGNFAAGTITAALIGNVTGNLTGNVVAGTVTASVSITGLIHSVGSQRTVVHKTSSYLATINDDVILCDATAGPMVITLPAASTANLYTITKTDASANVVTIFPSGSDNISGFTHITLVNQFDVYTLGGDGLGLGEWYVESAIIGGMGPLTGLTGDVFASGPGNAPATVNSVGGSSAVNIHNAELLANAATSTNTALATVRRDASGNFSATTISAALIGNVTGNVSESAASFTDSLAGDVTGTQGATSIADATVTGKVLTGYSVGTNTPILATDSILFAFEKIQAQLNATVGAALTSLTGDVSASGPGSATATVNSVGGQTAAAVAYAATQVSAATSSNTASTLVLRDATGNFSAGTISANLNGTATNATTSVNFTGTLTGDVTGIQSATVVSMVGGATAADVAAATATVDAATSTNTSSTLVERDASGNFAANQITASAFIGNLTGNVTGNVSGSAASFTDSLVGDVTGTQGATKVVAIQNITVNSTAPTDAQFLVYQSGITSYKAVSLSGDIAMTDAGVSTVGSVGGSSAASVNSAAVAVAAATSSNTVSTLVLRDPSGNFSAGTITAALIGNVTGNVSGSAASFTDSLVGDVTGTQGTTYVSKIQGTAVSGTTGSGNVVFSASPTLTGTITAAIANFSGAVAVTASSTTAFVVGTNTLVVDTTNNAVGINTAPASNAVLDIVNSSGSTKAIQLTGYGSNVGVRGRYANGTLLSPTAATTGNILEFISGRGYGTSAFASASTGAINIVAAATFTGTSMPTYLQFEVTPVGSVTIAEAMRIAPTGNVLIGTTTDSGTQVLQVSGSSNVGTVTSGLWNGTDIGVAYGGTGISTTPTNGQVLIGNGSGYSLSTLTAGTGTTVTNTSGSITIANNGVTPLVTKTGNYTILSTDGTILCDTSGGAFTLTLPSPTGLSGKIFRVIDSTGFFQSNNLTLAPSGAEKIEGLAAVKVLQTPWGWFTITTDGANWWIG